MEERVFAAALDVYGEIGWAGFTLDAVARRAHVGKNALYRRWASKVELLTAALLSIKIDPELIDTGHLRGDLIGVASFELALWSGPMGQVFRRVELDSVSYGNVLGPVRTAFRSTTISVGREIIQRAIVRGELHPDVSMAIVLDALKGSVEHRLAYLPDDRRDEFEARRADYIETLVDFVLAAADSPAARRRPR